MNSLTQLGEEPNGIGHQGAYTANATNLETGARDMRSATLLPAMLALAAFGCASFVSAEPLQQRIPAAVNYVSGGIGADERAAMQERSGSYNLKLVFAERTTGSYLADVKVSIAGADGATVLETIADGPWLYARLPAGKYRVMAEAENRRQERSISLTDRSRLKAHFYWP